jgi:hypothetical protein
VYLRPMDFDSTISPVELIGRYDLKLGIVYNYFAKQLKVYKKI